MPPGGVQRIIRSPAGDICAVGFARAVLVRVCRPEYVLMVDDREGVDIRKPSMCVDDVEALQRFNGKRPA